MKFQSGIPLNQSARRDSRGRTREEQDDLEAQLRAAAEIANGGAQEIQTDYERGIGTVDVGNTGDQYIPSPASTGRAEDPLTPGDVDEGDLENAARGRALELMTQGQIDLDPIRDNIRSQSQEAIAQSVGNANARLAGGGFGASGVQQNIEGTVRAQGAIAENEAILAAEQAARDENLRNILAGSGISQGERGLAADLDDRAQRNQMLLDILNGEDPESSVDPADFNEDGTVNIGEGSMSALLDALLFFGAEKSMVDNTRDGFRR